MVKSHPNDIIRNNLMMTKEIKSSLEQIYGYMPKRPEHLDVKVSLYDSSFCAGRAVYREYVFTSLVCGKEYSFTARSAILSDRADSPLIIHIDHYGSLPNRYTPCEEILDMGCSVFSFHIGRDEMVGCRKKRGLFEIGGRRGRRRGVGLLVLYAWLAMRITDHAITLPEIDTENIYVLGHGELAEAALLCCAHDTRIRGAMASGLSGISTPDAMLYGQDHMGGEDECQRIERLREHIQPRELYLSYAEGDPTLGDVDTLSAQPYVTMHQREGGSYLSRGDWRFFCDCVGKRSCQVT